MNKIVINGCYGGFCLSREAVEWLNEHYNMGIKISEYFPDANSPDIERYDPRLVECVETLGSDVASGEYAHLEVHTIPGNKYIIDEYDGVETLYWPEMSRWEEVPDEDKLKELINGR